MVCVPAHVAGERETTGNNPATFGGQGSAVSLLINILCRCEDGVTELAGFNADV